MYKENPFKKEIEKGKGKRNRGADKNIHSYHITSELFGKAGKFLLRSS